MEIPNKINEDLCICEETDGLKFGTDAYLLASYIRKNSKKKGLELCCGSGVISLLLLKRDKCKEVRCVDVQSSVVTLCQKNAEDNGLADRVSAVCADAKDYRGMCEADFCFFNPPYMRPDSGKLSSSEHSYLARHESTASIADFMRCAYRNVKDGGDVYAVYTPDRLSELMCAASGCGLEPKSLTLVYPTPSHRPGTVLLRCKKNAAAGITVTPPLIIYKNEAGGEYSDEMKYIYENMSFSEVFKS